MTACFLSNISAKYYKNPSMLSQVIAKMLGMFFLRHSVHWRSLCTTCVLMLLLLVHRRKIWRNMCIKT